MIYNILERGKCPKALQALYLNIQFIFITSGLIVKDKFTRMVNNVPHFPTLVTLLLDPGTKQIICLSSAVRIIVLNMNTSVLFTDIQQSNCV